MALTKVVVRAAPFQVTTELETKPLPLTVTVEPPLMVVTVLAEIPEICGAGLLIVNVAALEVPPPGAGFTTTTCAVPALAKSAAVTATCNWVELTNVVVRLAWFHWATELSIKPLPFTVTVVAAAPAIALEGVRELTIGIGFDGGAGVELPPPQAENQSNAVNSRRAKDTYLESDGLGMGPHNMTRREYGDELIYKHKSPEIIHLKIDLGRLLECLTSR